MLGKFGEEIAQNYLRDKGYKILERNFRGRDFEIDIIALSPENSLCFFEVKLRRSFSYGEPYYSVDFRKVKRILKGIETYISKSKWSGDVRFDVIFIIKEGGRWKIEHIKSAYQFD